MPDESQPKTEPAQEHAHHAGDASPVATVASGVLSAFFDELEKAEELKDKAGKLRALILGEGVMAEHAIRAILFPDTK